MRVVARHPGAAKEVSSPFAEAARLFVFKTQGGYVAPEHLARRDAERYAPLPTHEDDYRFVLSRSAVDGVLLALDRPSELRALASALARSPLTAGEEKRYVELARLAPARP